MYTQLCVTVASTNLLDVFVEAPNKINRIIPQERGGPCHCLSAVATQPSDVAQGNSRIDIIPRQSNQKPAYPCTLYLVIIGVIPPPEFFSSSGRCSMSGPLSDSRRSGLLFCTTIAYKGNAK